MAAVVLTDAAPEDRLTLTANQAQEYRLGAGAWSIDFVPEDGNARFCRNGADGGALGENYCEVSAGIGHRAIFGMSTDTRSFFVLATTAITIYVRAERLA